jgi:hypothetical protein
MIAGVRRTPRHRRALLASLSGLLAVVVLAASPVAGQAPARPADASARPRFRAVAFDYLVLFDANSVVAAADQAFPGKGRALAQLWRTRQFEYTWLRSITGSYVDFFAVTEDALVFATSAMKLELNTERKQRLLDAFLHLAPRIGWASNACAWPGRTYSSRRSEGGTPPARRRSAIRQSG